MRRSWIRCWPLWRPTKWPWKVTSVILLSLHVSPFYTAYSRCRCFAFTPLCRPVLFRKHKGRIGHYCYFVSEQVALPKQHMWKKSEAARQRDGTGLWHVDNLLCFQHTRGWFTKQIAVTENIWWPQGLQGLNPPSRGWDATLCHCLESVAWCICKTKSASLFYKSHLFPCRMLVHYPKSSTVVAICRWSFLHCLK